jgi:hypothetical protein
MALVLIGGYAMRAFTLVIPDIHQKLSKLETESMLARIGNAARVVYLGDYFDSHGGHSHNAAEVADFLTHAVNVDNDPDYRQDTFLLGNHDCHYLFRHPNFRCSGYQPEYAARIREKLDPVKHRFKLHAWVGPYLLSHAGFHPFALCQMEDEPLPLEHIPPYLESVTSEALRNAHAGGFHWLFYPGIDVGGAGFGGPTWMRWHRYVPIPGLPQIMGHTWQRDGKVKYAKDAYGIVGTEAHPAGLMLDTSLKHVAKIYHDDWTVEVVKL